MKSPDDSLVAHLGDQLMALGPVRGKRMFGGHGLFLGGTFFGIVHRGGVYFKTSAETVGEYERLGMKPFRPNEKQALKSYYEVPPDVIDAREQLVAWAGRAVGAQETPPRNRRVSPIHENLARSCRHTQPSS